MKLNGKLLTLALLSLLIGKGFGQGFLNLNFESANIFGSPGAVSASNAIPNWTAYISGVAQNNMLYDSATLSDPAISLHDANGFFEPIQGSYSLKLQGQFNPSNNSLYTNSVAIGQTGLIPSIAATLIFSASITVGGPYVSNLALNFNGQNLNFIQTGSGAGFSIYEANISAFAGQTGQLIFTVPYNGSVLLDNIQFSTAAVPEPSTLALVGLGGLGLAFVRKLRS